MERVSSKRSVFDYHDEELKEAQFTLGLANYFKKYHAEDSGDYEDDRVSHSQKRYDSNNNNDDIMEEHHYKKPPPHLNSLENYDEDRFEKNAVSIHHPKHLTIDRYDSYSG